MKKFSSQIFVVGVLFFCIGFHPTSAGQVPVTDVANLKATITDYLVTVKQLKADYTQITQLSESIEYAFKQAQALSGSRGMSILANNEIYKKHRRSLAFKNRYILDQLALGKLPTNKSDLTDGLLGLIEVYNLHSKDVDGKNKVVVAETPQAATNAIESNEKGKDRSTNASLLTNANSQLALANARRNVETFEILISELESADDIKATNDLLARISAENGLVLNQLLQLQATDISGRSERSIAADSNKRVVHGSGLPDDG
jgi:hypothetical protein